MRRAAVVVSSFLTAVSAGVAQQPLQPQPLQPVGGFGGQPTGGVKPLTQPGTATPTSNGGTGTAGGALPVVAAPAQPAAPDAATLQHLAGWEAAMREVKTFYVAATMSDKDLALKREAQFNVQMWLMKPNLARMDQTKAVPKGQTPTIKDTSMYISDGRTLHLYDGAQSKRVRVALGPGGAGNSLLLDLMSGMTTKQVIDRFAVKTNKVDQDYVTLEVRPLFKVDKEEFDSLLLVLCGAKYKDRVYIPRMIILNKSNGQQTETWDFPDPKVNPDGIGPKYFVPPPLPEKFTDEVRELPKAAGSGLPPKSPGGMPAATPGAGPRVPTPGSGK